MRRLLLSILLLSAILGGGTWISRWAAGTMDKERSGLQPDTAEFAEPDRLLADTAAVIVDSVGVPNANIN